MSGLTAVAARGELTSSPSSRTVPPVDTRQVSNPSAGPPSEIRPSVISLASARALGPWPAMYNGTLIGRSGNQPTDARIWATPPSMSAMSPRSNALTCAICVRMLARLRGFLPIPAGPVKPVPNPTIRRPGAICRGLCHRMAIARDQHGGAKFEALRLFGDAGESDPYVVAEGWNLGTPDRAKA